MASPRYAPTQLLSSATLTYRNAAGTTTSLGTQFPASNIADSRPGTVAKFPSVELGSLVAQWSAAKSWDVVAILNHNLEADCEFSIQKSSDGSSWTDVQTGLTLATERYWLSVGAQSSAWFRLLLTDLGSQAAIPYFGEVWVGQLATLSRNHAFGVRTGRGYNNALTRTTWGIPEKYAKNSYSYVAGVYAAGLSSSERTEVRTMLDALAGSGQPFLFIPDGDVATDCWVAEYTDDAWDTETIGPSIYSGFSLNVQEIPWGKPVS